MDRNINFSLNRERIIAPLKDFKKLSKFSSEAEKWYPDKLIPERITINISGLHSFYTNSLRRIIGSEVESQVLSFYDGDYTTNDGFLLIDYIRCNLNLVSLDQEKVAQQKYYLNVVNEKDNEHKNVYTQDIKDEQGNSINICNSNIKLFDLSPKSHIIIDNIHPVNGKAEENACFCEAFGTVNLPQKETENIIKFETNGNVSPQKMVRDSCLELISKIKNLQNYIDNIGSYENYYFLNIKNEDDTLGTIITKAALDLFPEVNFITYNVQVSKKLLVIKFKSEEPKKFLESIIKYLTNLYNNLYKNIK